MSTTKRIAIVSVLAGVFCGTLALAQTAKPKTDDFKTKALAATKKKLGQLVYYYKPTEDQKAKLQKVLIAQYKDLADYDKVHGPKIKAMDDEIAVLQKKIDVIRKQKALREKARDELLVDHKAEIRNVFTAEQRIARVSGKIRGSAVYYQYWAVLPEAAKTSLKSRCDAAAVELIQAGKADDRNAVSASAVAIRRDADKLLTPELRRNGEAQYLYNSAMQRFRRIKLTDAQKDSVRQLCSKAAEKKIRISAQYAQVSKDREALRRAIYKQSSRTLYYKIRNDAVQSILTDEQLKQGGFKRKSSTAGKKP